MKIISIFNEKGGVSKTTSAANISGALALNNKKVLVIDCDQQGNLSSLFGFKQILEDTIFDVLNDPKYDINNSIRETNFKNLFIIPGYKNLVDLPYLIQSNIKVNSYNRLQRQLRKIEDDFDYCIIDCAPGINIITTNILKASHEILAPVQLESAALEAIDGLADTLLDVRENYNEDLIIRGVFATRVNFAFKGHKEKLNNLKNKYGNAYIPYFIRTDQQVNDGADVKMPIVYYNKHSKAAKDYFKLTKEVILKYE